MVDLTFDWQLIALCQCNGNKSEAMKFGVKFMSEYKIDWTLQASDVFIAIGNVHTNTYTLATGDKQFQSN